VQLEAEPIGCIDIRNSQPAILGNLLTTGVPPEWAKRCLNIKIHPRSPSSLPLPRLSLPPPASVVSFAGLSSSGLLYDELAELCKRDRDFVKRRFLVDVLAKRGKYPSDVEDEFRKKFPDAWEAIQRINRTSHCNLIRVLQELEARLVIEEVSPELIDRLPVVTLHDAVYSRERDLGQVEEAFDQVLERIGWKLSFRPETTGGEKDATR